MSTQGTPGHDLRPNASSSAGDAEDPRPLGVVLAGGRSRRMGRDKAALKHGDLSWLEHAAHRLAAVCHRVVVAGRQRATDGEWLHVDDARGKGPAAGILGASQSFPEDDLLVLACDLPAIPIELLRYVVERSRSTTTETPPDLVIPFVGERFEPLCALYRRPALDALRRQVAGGHYALWRLAQPTDDDGKPLAVLRIEEAVVERWGDPQTLFANLNTPQDLRDFETDRLR